MAYMHVEHSADGGQLLVPLKFLLCSLKLEFDTNNLLSFQRKWRFSEAEMPVTENRDWQYLFELSS